MSGRYELLDSGNFAKLEQVGEYRLVRPALNAAWAMLATRGQRPSSERATSIS